MNIKLSVIVPVYNLQDYVEACIKSLVTQKTDFNYEVIVIDDKSLASFADVATLFGTLL